MSNVTDNIAKLRRQAQISPLDDDNYALFGDGGDEVLQLLAAIEALRAELMVCAPGPNVDQRAARIDELITKAAPMLGAR